MKLPRKIEYFHVHACVVDIVKYLFHHNYQTENTTNKPIYDASFVGAEEMEAGCKSKSRTHRVLSDVHAAIRWP